MGLEVWNYSGTSLADEGKLMRANPMCDAVRLAVLPYACALLPKESPSSVMTSHSLLVKFPPSADTCYQLDPMSIVALVLLDWVKQVQEFSLSLIAGILSHSAQGMVV